MADVLMYRGYETRPEFQSDSMMLYGRIEGIVDKIIFEAESIPEFVDAFHESVDDYLEICKEMGKDPEKPYKGVFNVRVPPEIHKRAAMMAYRKEISLNDFVVRAIRSYIDSEEEEEPKGMAIHYTRSFSGGDFSLTTNRIQTGYVHDTDFVPMQHHAFKVGR